MSVTKIIRSNDIPGTYISYKQTDICETTPGVKSYSGYIHFAPSALQGVQGVGLYNISTFFWFFEARTNPRTAPLAVYLAGGPGEASTAATVMENGPCYVGDDSNTTYVNPWSFNNFANMLYIDQPVQAGYSYDTLVNGTWDLLTNQTTPMDTTEPNSTLLAGTFPSQNINFTANTTAIGARTLWIFVQTWLSEFPDYTRNKSTSISFWGNSYGGFYVPRYAAHFLSQNQKIKDGTIQRRTIDVDTIGLTNGCVDALIQAPFYPIYAVNNTYNIETIPPAIAAEAINNYTKSGGCADQILQCRKLGAESDPYELGINETVNTVCANAYAYCFNNVLGAYVISKRSAYDISALLPVAIPPLSVPGFFNQDWVQTALGAPLNWTYNSAAVRLNFQSITGDPVRRNIGDLNDLLQNGVNVALIYGDRDFMCNWVGVENVSLQLDWAGKENFVGAGYTNISVNASFIGGVVRQTNGLSFSHIFQAGHSVSFWQPETVSKIFDRAMLHKNVATGEVDDGYIGAYKSKGPASSLSIRETLPESDVWGASDSCTKEQLAALANGTAVVQDFVVVEPKGVR
ncbi:hypothetical protein M406DRAFT_49615 [Cryphonectria parasitica EP155]|uniref:Alpha/beta-hydrolase n=1 Tax=Cryphonectria parasitica (strain ATCC 38755 / EP155) TaxID=660469 RepID=A0A9P4XVH2_CRYP1|nr:uncharacterized protein M406DRAFT_49615 [Cryphonectria parasitica EP155]KAF3762037.1 hypothetical protein M406DRAFT_49615 [Cryphonectria parasitica EP155]